MQNQLKMKEIVNVIKVTQVELSKIEDNNHIGILWPGGKKIKVIQTNEGFMGFSLLDEDLRSHWTRKSKNKYVEDALEQRSTKAYIFDSEKELLEWLLEN